MKSFPGHHRGAVSLTYDDGIHFHLDHAMPDLEGCGLRGTFYVTTQQHPADCWHRRPADWRSAAQRGHEIANHTQLHPCSRDYGFVKPANALEEYDLDRMERELRGAIDDITAVVGPTTSMSFAYTCCQDWVGAAHESFRPLAARLFTACRGGPQPMLADPRDLDFSFVPAWMLDESRELADILAFIDRAIDQRKWAVLMFHGVGGGHRLNVSRPTHQAVCRHIAARAADLWCDTFVNVALHLKRGVSESR